MVIVGMDETHGLGEGRYRQKNGVRRPLDIFLEHLRRGHALARGHKRTRQKAMVPHRWPCPYPGAFSSFRPTGPDPGNNNPSRSDPHPPVSRRISPGGMMTEQSAATGWGCRECSIMRRALTVRTRWAMRFWIQAPRPGPDRHVWGSCRKTACHCKGRSPARSPGPGHGLAGEEKTYELIGKMLQTIGRCLRSRMVIVGMDETLPVSRCLFIIPSNRPGSRE